MADDAAEQAYAAAVEEIARVEAAGAIRLDLSGGVFTWLDTIPPELAVLTELEWLKLDSTQVSDLAPLAGLSKLETLNLYNTQVSELAPLAGLTNLETLYLDNTQVSDLAPLARLTNLMRLDLDNTQVSDLAPLASLTNLETLRLNNTQVSDLAPLAGLTNLEWLGLNNTEVSNLTPLAGLTDLTTLRLANTYVSDLAPLAGLTKLMRLDLDNTQVSDLTALASLTNLRWLNLDDTNAIDLRPLTGLAQIGQPSAFQPDTFQANAFQVGEFSLRFRNTPATARDGRLAELAEIEDDQERTRKTLEYLRSLPPWPEPYTPAYTPDGSPPQPIGGKTEPDEVLVPAPVRAPLEVEVVDGRLRPARPGDGLGEDAHERARQAWQVLRDYLADLAAIRPRVDNQMPQLELALVRLEDALGADYEAANPIAMGIHGERVIAQAGAAGETMADTDAADLRQFAAALSLFLERFPAWRAYRDETAPVPPAAPGIEEAIPEIEAITEELREHEAIDPAIPESLEKQAGDVRSNPEDSLAKRGLVDSLNNFLGRLGEIVAVGKRWVAHEIKDIAGKTWTGFKVGLAATGAGLGKQMGDGLVAAARDFFAARSGELTALAAAHPEKFGWLLKFLELLSLA